MISSGCSPAIAARTACSTSPASRTLRISTRPACSRLLAAIPSPAFPTLLEHGGEKWRADSKNFNRHHHDTSTWIEAFTACFLRYRMSIDGPRYRAFEPGTRSDTMSHTQWNVKPSAKPSPAADFWSSRNGRPRRRGRQGGAILDRFLPEAQREAGAMLFLISRAKDNPAQFLFYELFRDEAAFKAHQESAHFKTYIAGQALPLLANANARNTRCCRRIHGRRRAKVRRLPAFSTPRSTPSTRIFRMSDHSAARKLDPREEHFRIPGPREELSLFLRFLPADPTDHLHEERCSIFTAGRFPPRFRSPIASTVHRGVTS